MLCIVGALVLGAINVASGTEVRLIGGKHPYEGRVEVKYDDTWRAICDHGWNKKASRVICRMLGFPDVLRFTKGHLAFGRGDGKFWLDDVDCDGREYDIAYCSHRDWGRHNCRSSNQAGVICKPHRADVIIAPHPSKASGEVMQLNVRLQGPIEDDFISEGIVQVEHQGKWGYICPSNWMAANSYVLCGQLGFPNFEKQESYRATLQDADPLYWLDKVTCHDWESSILSCDHAGWGLHQCEGGGALRIKCLRSNTTKSSEVRLRSGMLISEGRVEVKHKKSWGTICDDHWTLREANVVCRSLGYGTAALAAKNAYYGRGIGEEILRDVRCKGNEKNLSDCTYRGWSKSDCNHYEDASVKCHVPEIQGHEIRLRGGGNSAEGRVEVFLNGVWGTICADDWRIEEAMTVCRQLNLGYASNAATQNYFGPTRLRVIMSGVKCKVDETSLYNCERHARNMTKCSHKDKLAGVICTDALPDLVVDTDRLRREMRMDFIAMGFLRCALEERCLADSADVIYRTRSDSYPRKLLRFTVKIENRGWDHFRPNVPRAAWQWHQCHAHYHSMEVFSSYDLLRQSTGEKVAQGHKASFCLEDTKCDPGFEQTWNCTRGGKQGVSPGCYDIYSFKIDCQWVDCSDINHGTFFLRVNINPGNQVAESDFRNNIAKCNVYDYGRFVIANDCWIVDCESGHDTFGGNSTGDCCVFPFLYKTKLYHSCTTDGFQSKWCATTANFNRDRKWGLCFD